MKYRIIPVTPFEQNCTLLWCTETMKGAFVDPGGDIERLTDTAARLGVSVEKILLTHGHIDHAGGAGELATHLGVPDGAAITRRAGVPNRGRYRTDHENHHRAHPRWTQERASLRFSKYKTTPRRRLWNSMPYFWPLAAPA